MEQLKATCFLLGLTTTPGSDWRQKVADIDRLGIKELALFPTFIGSEDRKELYKLLEQSSLQRIPHVHLRSDMERWEIEFFLKRYGTEVFNAHPRPDLVHLLDILPNYKENLYIENHPYLLPTAFYEAVSATAGVCLDFSHWENAQRLSLPGTEEFGRRLPGYKVGCCHISAVKMEAGQDEDGQKDFCFHMASSLTDLAYMVNYIDWLPKYASLELENDFTFQLEAANYLNRLCSANCGKNL